MSKDNHKKRSRGVRVLGFAFLAIFLLLGGVALLIYFSWNSKPDHWTQMQESIANMSKDERQAVSASLNGRLLRFWNGEGELVTSPDKLFGQRDTVAIDYKELNVWLAEEGIGLLTGIGVNLPDTVKAAMVDSPGDGLLRVSCDYDDGKVQQIVSLSFKIAVDDDGKVVSTLENAVAGTLPLPTQSAIELIASNSPGDKTDGDMLLGMLQGTPVGPIDLTIDKARSGRLVGLEVKDDKMVITRETVRRQKKN